MKYFHGLPEAQQSYKDEQRFVVWKRVQKKDGSYTKPPYRPQAPEELAEVDDPSTWSDFATALHAYEAGQADGIGICLAGSNLVAFDLDHCRDPKTGAIEPAAQRLIKQARSYVELSPSQTGFHIFATGSGPEVNRKQAVPDANGMSVETCRRAGKYITVTGDALPEATTQLVNADLLVDDVVRTLDEAAKRRNRAEASGLAASAISMTSSRTAKVATSMVTVPVPSGSSSTSSCAAVSRLTPSSLFCWIAIIAFQITSTIRPSRRTVPGGRWRRRSRNNRNR